jgi:hypothetical protein
MLNLNIIHYHQPNINDLKKLRLALDNEFDILTMNYLNRGLRIQSGGF